VLYESLSWKPRVREEGSNVVGASKRAEETRRGTADDSSGRGDVAQESVRVRCCVCGLGLNLAVELPLPGAVAVMQRRSRSLGGLDAALNGVLESLCLDALERL